MRLNRGLGYQIKALLDAGHSQKTIANQSGISPGGLSKELLRNGGREKYDPGPRKRLGFLTPLEYISIQVKQIYLAT